MARIPPETIEQIAAANDVVDVIGGYFPLKRAGAMYRALCPFHQEKTPSFTVNPARQIFKCFGCGAGGSVFRFVMDYEQVDFVTAAKKLADRAGIRVVEEELTAEDQQRYDLRRRLLALHAEAADFFHQQLMKTAPAQRAREYLKGRGINGEIARTWKLGYAPDSWDTFSDFARQRGFTPDELVASGLVSPRDEGQAGGGYDRFRDRIMFPICNDTGEVIAFSGRVLDPEAKAAKYVNSPETMLFTKGAVLFGLHRSKRALIDNASAIVCEGQLDLITAFEAGVQNVIAPQGTAFTEKQAHILKRYVEEVVLCFDADAAGEKAAERSLAALLAENLLVRVIEMPPGEDPDSFIRSRGAAAFRERVAGARDFFEVQMDQQTHRPDFATPRGRLQAARKLAASISLISDSLLRETVINRASLRLEVSAQELARMLKAPRQSASDGSSSAAPPEAVVLDPTLRLLALITLRDADARAWVLAEPWREALAREPEGDLLIKILAADLRPSDPRSVNAFLTTLEAAEEAAITGLLEEKLPEHRLAIAHDCWRELERRHLARRVAAIRAHLHAEGLGPEQTAKLQKEFLDLQKRLSDIARPFSPPL